MRRIFNKSYKTCLRKLKGLFPGVSVSLKAKIHQVVNKFNIYIYYVISSNSKHDVTFSWDYFHCKNLYLFIYSVFCLTTGPKPPPKWCLQRVRSRASSFKWEYPLLSLRPSSSFLHLLATSISPFIFPSITCFRRQFLYMKEIRKLSQGI